MFSGYEGSQYADGGMRAAGGGGDELPIREKREEGGKGDKRDESARKLQLLAINVH